MFLCKRKTLVRLIGTMIILTALVLTGIRIVINLFPPTQQIRNWINQSIPYPVVIQDLDIGWHHFTPMVKLSQVEVFPTTPEASSKPALHIDTLQLRLNMWALLWRKIELKALVLQGAVLQVEESADGKLNLVNLPNWVWDPAEGTSASGKTTALFPAIQTLWIQDSALTITRKNGDVMRAYVDKVSGHVMRLVGITVHSHVDLNVRALHYREAKSQHEFNVAHFQGSLDVKKSPGQSSPRVEIAFKDVIVASPTHDLSVGPLAGIASLGGDQTTLRIKSHQMTIGLAQLFDHPLPVSDVAVELGFEKSAQSWVIHGNAFKVHYGHTPITGAFKLQFDPEKALPTLDLLVDVGSIDAKAALTALPRVWMPKQLTQWLDTAIVSGNILSTGMVLRGNLSDFPFDNQEGIFEVFSEIDQVHLAYDPHLACLTEFKS